MPFISATTDGYLQYNNVIRTTNIIVTGHNEIDLSTLAIPSFPGLAFDDAWTIVDNEATIKVS
jgi:hypothetical protein